MNTPAEILLFDFLSDEISSAASDSPLYSLELHDTVYQPITKDMGLRISEAVGSVMPGPDGELKEWDVELILVCWSRITGVDQRDRRPGLQQVFEIQHGVTELFFNDPTLGGRVCDLLVRAGARGYDVFDGGVYAVANIPLVINPSGAR